MNTTAQAPAAAPQAPARPRVDTRVELRIARHALVFVAVLAVPVLGVAWLAAGSSGLLGAAIGTGLVALLFGMSGLALTVAAPFGPAALMGAALGGFALRLLLYALLVVLLRPVEAVHGPSLAISAAVVMVATLAFEAWHVCRVPAFFWIDPAAGRPAAPDERNDG